MRNTASEALEFICRANKIGIMTSVIEAPDKRGYLVQMDYDWYETGSNSIETTYFPSEGEVDWDYAQNQGATLNFETAKSLFAAKLIQIGRESLKNKRRSIILSELSPEERMFLSPEL